MILLYAVNMYSSHKEVSLATSIAKQNKTRQESQTENKERRVESESQRDVLSQASKKQDVSRTVKPQSCGSTQNRNGLLKYESVSNKHEL